MMVVAPLSARVVERLGTKRVVVMGLSAVTAGLVLLSTIASDTPYPIVITYFMVMAAGMGLTMAPATEAVMGSLPRAKAGVGSAINDTTRQVGGALGVAIIGTVVSSVYASRIGDLTTVFGLTSPQAARAESSLGAAQGLAAGLGDRAGDFVAAANDSFVDALSIGLRLAAVAVVAAAVIAWKFLPAHATAPIDELEANAPSDTLREGLEPAPVPVAGD